MLSKRSNPINDIVNATSCKGEARQNLIHKSLEEGGRVLQLEGNHIPLPELALFSREGSLTIISLGHRDLMIPQAKVEFAKNDRTYRSWKISAIDGEGTYLAQPVD